MIAYSTNLILVVSGATPETTKEFFRCTKGLTRFFMPFFTTVIGTLSKPTKFIHFIKRVYSNFSDTIYFFNMQWPLCMRNRPLHINLYAYIEDFI